jgi:hypothetical protein
VTVPQQLEIVLGSFLTREHNHASTSVIELLFLAASIVTLNDLVTLDDTQIMIRVTRNTRTAVRDDTSSVQSHDSMLVPSVSTL